MRIATFEKFGAGDQSNEDIEKFFWRGHRTTIYLKYNPTTKEGSLLIASTVIMEEIEVWDERKAREGAETGF